MKVFVKTLRGTHFEIDVKSEDTVADVKKNIETVQGTHVYPAAQQLLFHHGKVLKDDTKFPGYSFILIMLSKGIPEAAEVPPNPPVQAPQAGTDPLTLFPLGLPEMDGNAPGGEIPQAETVTSEEREALERLEAMGFKRVLVLEVFLACDKDEELATNYLLDHMKGFEE